MVKKQKNTTIFKPSTAEFGAACQVEMRAWLGADYVHGSLCGKMPDQMRKDVEKLMEDYPGSKTQPERFTRKEQAAREAAAEAAAATAQDADPEVAGAAVSPPADPAQGFAQVAAFTLIVGELRGGRGLGPVAAQDSDPKASDAVISPSVDPAGYIARWLCSMMIHCLTKVREMILRAVLRRPCLSLQRRWIQSIACSCSFTQKLIAM